MAQAALKDYASAPFVELTSAHIKGSWLPTGTGLDFTSFQLESEQNWRARMDYLNDRVEVVSVGGRTFINASFAFWNSPIVSGTARDSALARVESRSSVVGSYGGDITRTLVSLAADLRGSAGVLSYRKTNRQKGSTVTLNGVKAVKLSDTRMDIYVTGSAPYKLLRVAYANGYRDGHDFTDGRFDLAYGSLLDVRLPLSYIDPGAPEKLPARFVVVADSLDTPASTCLPDACVAKAVVRNDGGEPVAQNSSTAIFTAHAAADDSRITDCTLAIPQIPHGQTEPISCVLQGADWTRYTEDRSHHDFSIGVKVENPIWDR